MSRSKSNSDFGELILWGIGAFALNKIFGKNEPLDNKGRGFLVPSSVNQGGKHLGVDISTLQYSKL